MFNELIAYREMFRSLVKRDLRTRYKGSVLGFMWTFVNPLLQLAVFSVVFSIIMRMNVENYPLFLFVTLLPWLFFSTTTQTATSLMINQANLIKKIYFPREILPLASTTAGLINLALCFLVALGALLLYGMPVNMSIVMLPVLMLINFLFTLGFVLLLSAVNVYFRDIEHIWGFIIMAWFYVTPIIYPLEMVPEQYLGYFYLNPQTYFTLAYRDILYNGVFPSGQTMLILTVLSVAILVIGCLVFRRLQRGFAESV